MKIELIKKVTTDNGKVLPKGVTLNVVNEYGHELIKAGKAVALGEAQIELDEINNENLD